MRAYVTQRQLLQRRRRRAVAAWTALAIAASTASIWSTDRGDGVATALRTAASILPHPLTDATAPRPSDPAAAARPSEPPVARHVVAGDPAWPTAPVATVRNTRAASDIFASTDEPGVVVTRGSEPAGHAGDGANAVVTEGLPAGGRLNLVVNRTTVLTTQRKYKQVSVGQPEVAEVTPIGPTSVLLTAKKPGATQLIIWDESDRSQVVDVVVDMDLEALREQIARSFPGAKVEVEAVNGAIALRGTVPSLSVADQIVASAAPFSERVLNFLEISGGQQVMLQVRFLEMSRRASQELGINLATSLTNADNAAFFVGPNVTRKTTNPLISTLTGTATWNSFTLDYALSALKQNNLARVLAEPNVTVISGQEASLLAGGEFPVPVPQSGSGGGSTITIEYKEFGVRLNVTPVVLGNGKIRLKVAPEVSDLDFSSPVTIENNNIPIINKRRVESVVEMGDGQTFAIAGLMRNSVIATRNVTPLLGELPVIGTLFRSVRYQREETELVVLVTPRMVEPMNPGEVPDLPGMDWRHPNPVEFYLNGDLGGPMGEGRAPAPADRVPPRFRGEYGFAPADRRADRIASVER